MQPGLVNMVKEKVQPKSYFGLPGRINTTYETDPAKISNTSTLSGALGGLVRAGAGGLANLGIRAYNAVASTGVDPMSYSERTADFAKREQQRYTTGGLTQTQPARQYQTMMAHSPGEIVAPRSAPSVPAPAAAPRGLRRAPAPVVSGGNPADPPQGFGETEAPKVTAPLITENTDAEGVLPASVASQVPITGANGGFGFTRNADGTVGEMYTLRQRTPEEDAAYAVREKMAPQNQGITTDRNGVPYGTVDTSPGSQAAWAREQQMDSILNRPLGLKLAAHAVAQQNADTMTSHYGTEDMKTRTLLPGEVALQGSGLKTAAAQRRSLDAGTGKTQMETQLLPVTTQADLGLKAAQAKQASQHGDYYSTQGAVKDAQVANLTEKLASAEKIAEAKDATNKEKIAAAGETADKRMLKDSDPNFAAKYTAVGGKLENYVAANEIEALQGLEFKAKPFKTGVIGMRTTHPAGWYKDGQLYRMADAVAEHLKRKGGSK